MWAILGSPGRTGEPTNKPVSDYVYAGANDGGTDVKVLVTGGAGYIGSTVATLLLDAGHDVTIIDDLSTGHADAVSAGARFVRGRVHQVAADVITAEAGFDAVMHFAAFIAAGESVRAPEKYWENNVLGSLRLLDAVRAARVPRFVFSSTANIYGNPTEIPIAETSIAAPPNPYATSKLAVEYALTGDADAHGLAVVTLRYFNAAGALIRPSGSCGERHDPETHLIPNALLVAAGRADKLPLFGDDYPTPDGTCVRDYIHVADLAGAHLRALEVMNPGEHRLYNLGTGTGFSNREVVEAVREVTGHPVPVEMAPRRPGDPAVLVASSAKARAELGWEPQRPTLQEIIADAWAFARSR
jgi:UDP-glucose 4-epimerase